LSLRSGEPTQPRRCTATVKSSITRVGTRKLSPVTSASIGVGDPFGLPLVCASVCRSPLLSIEDYYLREESVDQALAKAISDSETSPRF
jgi:hypothetical protein